jgi:hypothetical protein
MRTQGTGGEQWPRLLAQQQLPCHSRSLLAVVLRLDNDDKSLDTMNGDRAPAWASNMWGSHTITSPLLRDITAARHRVPGIRFIMSSCRVVWPTGAAALSPVSAYVPRSMHTFGDTTQTRSSVSGRLINM